jgi:hypothetical protein
MASHLRYVVKVSGGYYAGKQALDALARFSGHAVKTKAEAIAAAKQMNANLWVFREPRKATLRRSRYKRICWNMGLGHRPKVKKLAFPPLKPKLPKNPFLGGLYNAPPVALPQNPAPIYMNPQGEIFYGHGQLGVNAGLAGQAQGLAQGANEAVGGGPAHDDDF